MSKNVPIYIEQPISSHEHDIIVPQKELDISAGLFLDDDSSNVTGSTLNDTPALINLDFDTVAVNVLWVYDLETPVNGLSYTDNYASWTPDDLTDSPILINGNKSQYGIGALWWVVLGVNLGIKKSVKKLVVYDYNYPAGNLDSGWNAVTLYGSADGETWTNLENITDIVRSGGGYGAVGTIEILFSQSYEYQYFCVYTNDYPLRVGGSLLTSFSEIEAYSGTVAQWSVGADLGVGGQAANKIEIYDYTTYGGEGLDWSGENGSLTLYQSADNATWTLVETFINMSRQEYMADIDIYKITIKFHDTITARYFKLYCSDGTLLTAIGIPVEPSEIRIFTDEDVIHEEYFIYAIQSVEAATDTASKRIL